MLFTKELKDSIRRGDVMGLLDGLLKWLGLKKEEDELKPKTEGIKEFEEAEKEIKKTKPKKKTRKKTKKVKKTRKKKTRKKRK